MDITSHMLSLAWKFPRAAGYVIQAHRKCSAWVASLSPDVRKRIRGVLRGVGGAAVSVSRFTENVYIHVISYPNTPPTKWSQPSRFILVPLAHLILFFQPVVADWEGDIKDGKVLFVANKSVWGLEMPAMHSVIYLKTGKLVRFQIDPLHFKLPLWKHVLEYFGAVPFSPSIYPELMGAGYTMVWFPSSEISDSGTEGDIAHMYPIDTGDGSAVAPGAEFAVWALDSGYAIVPVANIGMSDMLPVRFHVSLEPIYTASNVVSRILPSSLSSLLPHSSPHKKPTLPIVLPRSYERQYMRFASPARTDGPFRKLLESEYEVTQSPRVRRTGRPSISVSTPRLATTLSTRTLYAIDTNLLYLRELRDADPRRHVLAPVWNVGRRLGQCVLGMEKKMKGSEKLVRRHSAKALRAMAGWVDIEDEGANPEKMSENVDELKSETLDRRRSTPERPRSGVESLVESGFVDFMEPSPVW
ncbi:uncharacterized protein SPPG_06129 [Spizellomyces punctatus DAOM BR117]|uniref:Uncharacterized protein n=1 Tax=Spizellomyces punctatus (strain DAOM BR117) TaxID=645134 RepID=A0A0L0HA41_SPIPD|nr:uncharacterized protein SPPG_06129 [Spizellomyces punctatus DAOM BR117]KNC98425.1 hypothetical protein SPPG_06129 [Spizellomyces punctatus DAOM BR117]|eukprot:XP_016606465.1 hypothetical protein SPPG_06129 [Spizellomyces punctatus DAOM BR117]